MLVPFIGGPLDGELWEVAKPVEVLTMRGEAIVLHNWSYSYGGKDKPKDDRFVRMTSHALQSFHTYVFKNNCYIYPKNQRQYAPSK